MRLAANSLLYRATAVALVAVACSDDVGGLERVGLTNGMTVAEWVRPTDSVVVLLYDPGDCFACYSVLSQWLEWGRRHPGRVMLVLTRPPKGAQEKQLLTYRIVPNAELAHPVKRRTPAEYLFVEGVVRRAVVLEEGQTSSPILSALTANEPR